MVRLIVTTALALGVSAAQAGSSDSLLKSWFDSLRQPGTRYPCCSIADCRTTEIRMRGNEYEVPIEGQWLVVPSDRILQRKDNPTGSAVVCWTPGTGIMCFIRPPET
jgi:hypothetical protein